MYVHRIKIKKNLADPGERVQVWQGHRVFDLLVFFEGSTNSDLRGTDIPKQIITLDFNQILQSTNVLCSCNFNCEDFIFWIPKDKTVDFEDPRHDAGTQVEKAILQSMYLGAAVSDQTFLH